MTQKTDRYTISLSDCLEDIAENFVYAESEYSHVPSFVLVPLMFETINDLILPITCFFSQSLAT